MAEFKKGDLVFVGKYGHHGVITKVTDRYYNITWASDIITGDEWSDVRMSHATHMTKSNPGVIDEMISGHWDDIVDRKEHFLSLLDQTETTEREIVFRPGLTKDQTRCGLNMAEKNRDVFTGTKSFYDGKCVIAFMKDRITIRLAKPELNEI